MRDLRGGHFGIHRQGKNVLRCGFRHRELGDGTDPVLAVGGFEHGPASGSEWLLDTALPKSLQQPLAQPRTDNEEVVDVVRAGPFEGKIDREPFQARSILRRNPSPRFVVSV